MGLDALLKNQLAHGPSSKSCTYTLFLIQDVEIEHIFALWAVVSETMADFQYCHIWPWNLAVGQNFRSGTYTLFLTQGPKLSSCSLWFPRYWPIFKISYLGRNSRCCTYTLFLPQGVEIELIFALPAAVSKIRAHFQYCHIWARNLASGQSSKSCTYIT